VNPLHTLLCCADCGRVQRVPAATRQSVPECACCGHEFEPTLRGDLDTALAWSVAAILLLLPPFLSPLMTVTSFGIYRHDLLPSGVEAMYRDGYGSLAVLIFLFSIAFPFLYLLLMTYVLESLRRGRVRYVGRVYRYVAWLRPWPMIEVFLVGGCVAYSRLGAVGSVEVGMGGWCLIGACVAWLGMSLKLDPRMIWDSLPTPQLARAPREPLTCTTCELLLDARHAPSHCPRCGDRLYLRKPDSLRRTTALLVTGYLLYIPANILPILTIVNFGKEDPNTILGGVHELITNGLWPLAVLVFVASVIVPLLKLGGLSTMLIMTHLHSKRWLMGRTQLYRLIDLIGRWSNIDVFMISLLAAMVQFGNLTTVRPKPGAIAFAAVVVITMIASRCFDPRLMWDAAEDVKHG
jgi:paraquat-inducible protein A